jgi:putative FmdB family regulatory protein
MPTYVFRCEACATVLERFMRFADLEHARDMVCPHCQEGRLQRVWTVPLVLTLSERRSREGGSPCGCRSCHCRSSGG